MNKMYLLFLFLIGSSVFLYGKEINSITRVKKIEGQVFIRSEIGKRRNAERNMDIFGEDTIITGKNSKCIIDYSDKTIIEISKDSEIKINEIIDEDYDFNSITCIIGSLFIKVKKPGTNEIFQVIMPSATIEVQEAQFVIAAGMDGSGFVGLIDGTVDIKDVYDKKVLIETNGTLEINFNSEMQESNIFKYKDFNYNKWMEESRNFFNNNKESILKSLEDKMLRTLDEHIVIQNNIKIFSVERQQLIENLKKAEKKERDRDIKKYRTKLEKNSKDFLKIIQQFRVLYNNFIGNSHMIQFFFRSGEFANENIKRLKKINDNKTQLINEFRQTREIIKKVPVFNI